MNVEDRKYMKERIIASIEPRGCWTGQEGNMIDIHENISKEKLEEAYVKELDLEKRKGGFYKAWREFRGSQLSYEHGAEINEIEINYYSRRKLITDKLSQKINEVTTREIPSDSSLVGLEYSLINLKEFSKSEKSLPWLVQETYSNLAGQFPNISLVDISSVIDNFQLGEISCTDVKILGNYAESYIDHKLNSVNNHFYFDKFAEILKMDIERNSKPSWFLYSSSAPFVGYISIRNSALVFLEKLSEHKVGNLDEILSELNANKEELILRFNQEFSEARKLDRI